MDQVSHLFPSVFLCFPCISTWSFPTPFPSAWLEEAEPSTLTALQWLPFMWDYCEHAMAWELMEGHEEKICSAQDIKWTWLSLLLCCLYVLSLRPISKLWQFVLSTTHSWHFLTDLLLWVFWEATNAVGIFQWFSDHIIPAKDLMGG